MACCGLPPFSAFSNLECHFVFCLYQCERLTCSLLRSNWIILFIWRPTPSWLSINANPAARRMDASLIAHPHLGFSVLRVLKTHEKHTLASRVLQLLRKRCEKNRGCRAHPPLHQLLDIFDITSGLCLL